MFDAIKMVEKHFSNLMYLEFFVLHPDSTFYEKCQAEKEIEIAKRKLDYWKRMCEVQETESEIPAVIQKIKKKWA